MNFIIAKYILLFSLLVFPIVTNAQNISVSSFKLLENDLTANTTGTMERDQNGEVAALIKVVTTEQGFVFDGGMSGIVKTKQGVGEVWVYVPHGIRRITIQHPQLGVLRDYYFPIPIDKAKTYEMKLTTGKVETLVTHAINKQFVVFNVTPFDAIVDFNEEMLTVDSDGVAQKLVPYGTYDYRVTHPGYHTTAGKVTVGAQGKAEVNVTLRPNFGWINVDGGSEYHGAYIYIDNERVGQLPFTSGKLKSGTHRVKVVKSMYKTYEQQVTVSDNETTELNVELVPNFASVTLKAGEDCEIWVDGQRKGNAQWQGPLEIGEYVVEVRKTSHHSSSEIVYITASEERIIQLKSPKPIYTSIEITSTPSNATVYIDGVESGTTPMFKTDILVGAHRIEFRKEGYGAVNQSVNLQEGEENKVSVKLTNQREISIVSTPSGAEVSIDGVYKGVTPINTTLTYGKHALRFTKSGYETASKSIDVNSQSATISQMLSAVSQRIEITSSPSNASVDINGNYKGTTPLNIVLPSGQHLISLSKNGYKSYSVYRSVPTLHDEDFHFKLEKAYQAKTSKSTKSTKPTKVKHYKPATNKNYKWLSLYADGYGGYALGNQKYATEGGWGFGYYLWGFNFESNYGLASIGCRGGWGIEYGSRFLITPQIGFVGMEYLLRTSEDYYQGYYEDDYDYYISYTLGCRVQYCLNKFFAVYVTPEYGIAPESGNASTFHIRAGLTFNLGIEW